MKKWDHALRSLAALCPSDVSSLVLERRVEVETAPTVVASITRDLDFVAVVLPEKVVLHLEFESKRPTRVALRLRLVNALLRHRHRLPVLSIVVSLRGRGPIVETFEEIDSAGERVISRFVWQRLNLGSIPAEDLLDAPTFGGLPLVPLTRNGQDVAILERAVRRIERDAPVALRGELLAHLVMIAGLRDLGKVVQTLMENRAMQTVSMLFQEWEAAALAKGKAEGLAEATADVMRATLELILTERFGPLPARDRRRLAAATPLDPRRATKAALQVPTRAAFFEWLKKTRGAPAARTKAPRRPSR